MNDFRYQHLLRQDCPLPPGTHVFFYCRDSGGENQERSVGQQIEAGREYCERWGLFLERVFKDEAEEATAIERRDAFNDMLQEVKQRFRIIYDPIRREKAAHAKPFGILFWKSNRIGRDLVHTRHVKADIRLRGITIVGLMSTFETGNPAVDTMMETWFEYQDEELLKEISSNAKRGLAELVTMRDNDVDFLAHNPGWVVSGSYLGLKPGTPPVGFIGERLVVGTYKRKNNKRSGELRICQRLVPDPETWERARLAWQMRHDGATIAEVLRATRLYKTVGGYNHFFENLIYTGSYIFGGHLLETFVPALIPVDWWELEQTRIMERSFKRWGGGVPKPEFEPRRVGGSYLLSGILYCGAVEGEEHAMHGDVITGKDGRAPWEFYICSTKKNSRGAHCTASRISASNVEDTVIERLMNQILTRDKFRRVVDQVSSQLDQVTRDAQTRLDSAQSEFKAVERQLTNLLAAIEDMGLSPSLKDKLTAREADKQRLQDEVTGLWKAIAAAPEMSQLSDDVLDAWLGYLHSALKSTELEVARRALRQFVEKVVVHGDEMEIYYRIPMMQENDGEILGGGKVLHRGRLTFPSHKASFTPMLMYKYRRKIERR